jgi:hypothetical protein
VIAFLHGDSSIGTDAQKRAFHQGLNESGFVEGLMSPSNITLAGVITIDCLPWRPIWCAVG